MPWFGVRSVYWFDTKSDGTNVFEERVVVFEAETSQAALQRAAAEADEYVAGGTKEVFPEWHAYEQDGDALIDGYEVWSQLFEARMSLEEFHAARYRQFEYEPEPRLALVPR